MKKTKLLLATAATLAITNIATAQKGGILLYGDFGFTHSKTTDTYPGAPDVETTSNDFTFSPGIGYCVSNNIIVGLNVGVNSHKDESPDYNEPDLMLADKSMNISVGPFFRYVKHLGDIFDLRAQANTGAMFGHTSSEFVNGFDEVSEDKTNTGGFYFNIVPQVGVNIGNGWCVDFGFGAFGFQSSFSKPDNADGDNDGDSSTSNIGMNLNGNTLRWGVSKTFGGSK